MKTVRVWRIEHTFCSEGNHGHGPGQGSLFNSFPCVSTSPVMNYTMPEPDRIESGETCAMLPEHLTDWLEESPANATALAPGWCLVQYEIPESECRIDNQQVIVSEFGYVNSPVSEVIIWEFPVEGRE